MSTIRKTTVQGFRIERCIQVTELGVGISTRNKIIESWRVFEIGFTGKTFRYLGTIYRTRFVHTGHDSTVIPMWYYVGHNRIGYRTYTLSGVANTRTDVVLQLAKKQQAIPYTKSKKEKKATNDY